MSCHVWQVLTSIFRLTAVCLCADASSLALVAEKQNAHSGIIWSVGFNKDGSQIVSGSSDKTIKVWGELPYLASASLLPHDGPCCLRPDAASLALIEERVGDGETHGKSGEVAERNGATLRLKAGGAFYAPSPLECFAVHWPQIVAGAQSGELYHLEVEE